MSSQFGLRADLSELFLIPYLPVSSPASAQPPGIKIPLLPHQLRSLYRMRALEIDPDNVLKKIEGTFLSYKIRGGCLSDEVGMGKTATVIGLILAETRSTRHGCNLVVTPSHLFKQWRREIEKFAGDAIEIIEGKAV